VKIIAIEEHRNSAGIRAALDRLPDGARDESVAFNSTGDNQARLADIGAGQQRDAAGAPAAARARLHRCRPGAVLHRLSVRQPGAAAAGQFFSAIPDPAQRASIASGNAEALFGLA
jgi:hypothetical protein